MDIEIEELPVHKVMDNDDLSVSFGRFIGLRVLVIA